MGKKGEKKETDQTSVENVQASLPTIPEEENVAHAEHLAAKTHDHTKFLTPSNPQKSNTELAQKSLTEFSKARSRSMYESVTRSQSQVLPVGSKSILKGISKSYTLLEESGASKTLLEAGDRHSIASEIHQVHIVEEKKGEEKKGEEKKGKEEKREEKKGEEKKGKGKKGKKGKKEKLEVLEDPEATETAGIEEEDKPKKAKKEKKVKDEEGGEKKSKKSKKGKKTKSEILEDEEIKLEPAPEGEKSDLGLVEEPEEKSVKKDKEKKTVRTEEKEPKEKKSKGKKGKKEKIEKATKETQIDAEYEEEERDDAREPLKSESRIRAHPSRVSFSAKIIPSSTRTKSSSEVRDRSRSSTFARRKTRDSRESSDDSLCESPSFTGAKRRSSSRRLKERTSSVYSYEEHIRRMKKRASSRTSDSDILSTDSSEDIRGEKEDHRRKKKGKKDKKHKGEKEEQKQDEEEKDEELEELKEQKKAEERALKETKIAEKKAAKKAAKLAAKQAAKEAAAAVAAAAKKAKGDKPGEMDYEEVKKKLEDLKKTAREMGIDIAKVEEGEEEGPKKKMSKKEKARITAEMAEKAKAELEAEAKRMEELIKKKKEEERLAAIEKDKKEIVEQGLRMEQLQASSALIQDIIDTNAEITRKEKELLEWEKYVECGKLPNPSMCDQMNTYLHLWELVLEQTSMEVASNMTKDALKLLSDLDELIDTRTEEEENKVENWKWIRQLFREYQDSSLDVATYQLLRDVENNLNRINIPTADFNFQDDYVTLCIWLRVMLPIPLPNPRRPPKPRIDISFNLMDVSVLFPITITCDNAAIRSMYLKYDHLSDLSNTHNMPEVSRDYYMDLLSLTKKEWRVKLKYKYDHRDKKRKPAPVAIQETSIEQDGGASSPEILENPEQKPDVQEKTELDKKIEPGEPEDFASDEEIPLVPFKQLKPTASEHAIIVEDQLYQDTRTNLVINVPEDVINLRQFVILGGVYHLNLLAQPPQPQDFITMEMTITGLYLPKKLEVLPFKVIYTPYIPPEPEPSDSSSSLSRKLPEEMEEEAKKQEEELDKLIAINIKWPQHVIFLELPIVCRWNEETKQWSKEEIHDLKHNEEKCILSFRTGVFGIYGLATYKYANLPFQAYDIKPEIDDSVTVQLTAAILMLEFNIKDGLISLTQLQNSPNMTLQDVVGKFFKLHQLKRMMKEAGIDIFPAFDAFCYVEGCCEKQWALEKHLYYNMAQMANSFNFSWSRWNLQAGRRKIVLQMRQYAVDKGKQKNHQMLLVTPLKATFIDCTEVSQTFSDKEIESLKFCADLYHLMRTTSGIFVRNKVMKASKQNVYTLAQFLIATRIMSFS